MPASSKWSPSLWFPHQNITRCTVPNKILVQYSRSEKKRRGEVFVLFNPQYTKPSSSTLFTKLGSSDDPMVFCNFSTVWCGRLLKLCFFGFWNYNTVIQALLASNILFIYFNRSNRGHGTSQHSLNTQLIQHLNNVIFSALSAGHFSNLQRSEPKNNKNNNIPHS
jgi:uncharacterized membrane protein